MLHIRSRVVDEILLHLRMQIRKVPFQLSRVLPAPHKANPRSKRGFGHKVDKKSERY